MPHPSPGGEGRRDTASITGGLVLIAIAIIAFLAMRELDSGSMSELGPGGLPRVTAILLGLVGLVITVMGWRQPGDQPITIGVRGLVVIMLAIAVFAFTLRPFELGPITTPGLGLVGAGPLSILVAGLATRKARWLELAALACGLTAFCLILFGDLLALPIPVYPVSWLSIAPAGWGQIGLLRALAAGLAILGVAIALTARGRRTSGEPA